MASALKNLRRSTALVAAVLSLATGCTKNAQASATAEAPELPEVTAPAAPPATNPLQYDPRVSLAPMIDAVQPAVVSIRVKGKPAVDLFGMRHRGEGAGSGFIYSDDGIVITNHHVADGAQELEVHLADGRTFDATLRGSDAATDLAVLELKDASGLPVVELGSSEGLRVGDWVVAIGNPMGLDHSASVGIVSAHGRGNLGLYEDSYLDFLQTDADIAPGSSGGPLFDLQGKVVGINTAVSASRAGFAIPIDQAKKIIPQLLEHGKVVRGWLGASNDPQAQADRTDDGAVIGQVFANTPAAAAGLQEGDIVVGYNGKPVKDFNDLRGKIAMTQPGQSTSLKVERGGKTLDLSVVLAERPDRDAMAEFRMGPRPGGPEPIGERLGAMVEPHKSGLEVKQVQPRSLAAELGLEAGDIIERINGETVKTPTDVKRAMRRQKLRIELDLKRNGVQHHFSLRRS